MSDCVCGCPAANHHAWTGRCHGLCGCSYYDDGAGTNTAIGPTAHTRYDGRYSRHYELTTEEAS